MGPKATPVPIFRGALETNADKDTNHGHNKCSKDAELDRCSDENQQNEFVSADPAVC
jgi:hypothetical protein